MVKAIASDVLCCLCLVCLSCSLPLNGLSPSLSIAAVDLGYTPHQRDLYLGGYMSIATMIGQLLGSIIAAFTADSFNRKQILLYSLVVASCSMILFGLVFDLKALLFLRVLAGGCQGTVVPVIFSLIGDFCCSMNRTTTTALVSSCLGGGMMVGQLFAGFALGSIGWRLPFLIMGFFSIGSCAFVFWYLYEPARGSAEDDGGPDDAQLAIKLPKLTWSMYFNNIATPTVAIMLLQTVPSTIPWGILSTHLHDYLATDVNLSMEKATSLIAIFGGGAAIGGIMGGILGQQIYLYNRNYLPISMGIAMIISARLLHKLLVLVDEDEFSAVLRSDSMAKDYYVTLLVPTLLLISGALAAINGANIRVLIINVCPPTTRGAVLATLNIVNCLGRGVGPSLADYYSTLGCPQRCSRSDTVQTFLNLWLLSGLILIAAGKTFGKDEEKMKLDLLKARHESENNKV